MEIKKQKAPDINIIQFNAFLVNGEGGCNVFGLGSDQRMYIWNYNHGAWFQNWENKDERKLREKAEKKQIHQPIMSGKRKK